MEDDYLELDKEYLKTFNVGYTLSDIGVKEDILNRLEPQKLEEMNINKSELAVIRQGMRQHIKDVEQGYAQTKDKNIEFKRSKAKEQLKDKGLQKDLKKKREQEKKKGKNKGYNGYSR